MQGPPPIPDSHTADTPFYLTLRVCSFGFTGHPSEPTYHLPELFQISHDFYIQDVTFQDLAKLPYYIWKFAKYPAIFNVYPQNVPLKDITERVKKGQRLKYVSLTSFTLDIAL